MPSTTEYQALRSEILERIKLRQQVVSGSVIVFGTMAGFALQLNHLIALIYPVLAFLICLSWAQNHYRIKGLALYIRTNFETASADYGWETFVQERRSSAPLPLRTVAWPHGGILIGTQILAIAIAYLKLIRDETPPAMLDYTIGGLGIVFLLLTLWTIRKAEGSAAA